MVGTAKGERMKCVESLVLEADYYVDNCTFFCQLEDGHEGLHVEVGEGLHKETGEKGGAEYRIEWSTQG